MIGNTYIRDITSNPDYQWVEIRVYNYHPVHEYLSIIKGEDNEEIKFNSESRALIHVIVPKKKDAEKIFGKKLLWKECHQRCQAVINCHNGIDIFAWTVPRVPYLLLSSKPATDKYQLIAKMSKLREIIHKTDWKTMRIIGDRTSEGLAYFKEVTRDDIAAEVSLLRTISYYIQNSSTKARLSIHMTVNKREDVNYYYAGIRSDWSYVDYNHTYRLELSIKSSTIIENIVFHTNS